MALAAPLSEWARTVSTVVRNRRSTATTGIEEASSGATAESSSQGPMITPATRSSAATLR